LRASGVPSRSRGTHSSGTVSKRPPSRSREQSSLRGCCLGVAGEMTLLPCPRPRAAVLSCSAAAGREFGCAAGTQTKAADGIRLTSPARRP
jgi:hypothetical protein